MPVRILLVTLCLLSITTSASAECAWVLWLKASIPTLERDPDRELREVGCDTRYPDLGEVPCP